VAKKWKPREIFEHRIPKEVYGDILRAGYEAVPPGSRESWLQARFIIPAGWPMCERYARISGVTRVRERIAEAISRAVGYGKLSAKQRSALLWKLVHMPTENPDTVYVPHLRKCALEDTMLQPAERLWLLLRPGVLSTRSTVLALAHEAARRAKGVEFADVQCAQIRQTLGAIGMTARTDDGGQLWWRHRTLKSQELHLMTSATDPLFQWAAHALISVLEGRFTDALHRVVQNTGRCIEESEGLTGATRTLLELIKQAVQRGY
jgi:hypothetical protein